MRTFIRVFASVFVVVVIALPVAYFAARWHDRSYLDNALGNWLATIIGVAAGVPLGLEVNRRLQHAQTTAQRERDAAELTETRQTLLMQLEYELRENRDQVGNLQLAAKKSEKSRTELWDWAENIIQCFQYDTFRKISEPGVASVAELNDITLAYNELRRLQNYVMQAKAAHIFYHAHSGSLTPADEMPAKVFAKTAAVLQRMEAAERARTDLAKKGA